MEGYTREQIFIIQEPGFTVKLSGSKISLILDELEQGKYLFGYFDYFVSGVYDIINRVKGQVSEDDILKIFKTILSKYSYGSLVDEKKLVVGIDEVFQRISYNITLLIERYDALLSTTIKVTDYQELGVALGLPFKDSWRCPLSNALMSEPVFVVPLNKKVPNTEYHVFDRNYITKHFQTKGKTNPNNGQAVKTIIANTLMQDEIIRFLQRAKQVIIKTEKTENSPSNLLERYNQVVSSDEKANSCNELAKALALPFKDDWLCPLSLSLMSNPVFVVPINQETPILCTLTNGRETYALDQNKPQQPLPPEYHIFEREWILKHFDTQGKTDPLNKQQVQSIVTNTVMRKEIHNFLASAANKIATIKKTKEEKRKSNTIIAYRPSTNVSTMRENKGNKVNIAHITDVVAAKEHTFFLDSNGHVFACGSNKHGQLGLGDIKKQTIPTLIPELTNIQRIVASEFRSYFLNNKGQVFVCGYSTFGDLGVNPGGLINTPTPIPTLSNIQQIVLASSSSFFLDNKGQVFACGSNDYGDLGVGDRDERSTPALIPELTNIQQIITSDTYRTYFLNNNGQVFAAGLYEFDEWDIKPQCKPVLIPGLTNIQQIVACPEHSLFLNTNGQVFAAGSNEFGQLGLGDKKRQLKPTLIPELTNIKQIASGYKYTLFLNAKGVVFGCGDNEDNQLGLEKLYIQNQSTPTLIPGLNNIKHMVIGIGSHTWRSHSNSNYSLFLNNEGQIFACGCNSDNQLGYGDTQVRFENGKTLSEPTLLPQLTNIRQIIAEGNTRTFFLNADHLVFGCGYDFFGALGLGNKKHKNRLTKIPYFDDQNQRLAERCNLDELIVLICDNRPYSTICFQVLLKKLKLSDEHLELVQKIKPGIKKFLQKLEERQVIQSAIKPEKNCYDGSAHKKVLLSLLTLQDTDNNKTLGMFIAENYDVVMIKAYLDLLSQLIKEKTLSAKRLFSLLTLQNKESHKTLGMFIACCQGPVATKAYLNFLTQLVKEKTFCAKELLLLLTLQGKDNRTLLDMITSYYQDVIEAYLDLLSQFVKEKTLSAKELLSLLTLQNKSGDSNKTLGMFITEKHNPTATKVYLDLLNHLIKKNTLSAKELFSLFKAQDKDSGKTVGMFIACYQTIAATLAYLNLLKQLVKKKILSAKTLISLLTLQDKETGNTLGMFVAEKHDETATKIFLDLLAILATEKTINAKERLSLFTPQSRVGGTLGMFITCHQNAATTKAYLGLLLLLFKERTLSAKELLSILTLQDANNCTLGMIITFIHDAETTKSYLDFLSQLAKEKTLSATELLSLLTTQNKDDGKTLGVYVTEKHNSATAKIYLDLLTQLYIKKGFNKEHRGKLIELSDEISLKWQLLSNINVIMDYQKKYGMDAEKAWSLFIHKETMSPFTFDHGVNNVDAHPLARPEKDECAETKNPDTSGPSFF